MRSITAGLAALVVVLALAGPAAAGTFIVPFGNGVPMGAAGWSTKADAGALCGYEGTGTVFLNAGTLPAHSGCFYLFNAPAAAQIMAVNTTLGYTKASTATALCAYSFAAVAGDTLRRCEAGTTANAVATSGANWFEMGIYNEGVSTIALTTARANNVVFASGWVTLADPSAPGLAANGPSGVQTGLTAGIQWEAFDPESGAPSIAYAIDGGARIALRAQSCSWLCGAGASGSAAIDLSALADGPHAVTVYAGSYADAEAHIGPLAFTVDRNAPAQPQIQVEPDAAAPALGWWGHAPIALTLTTPTAADVASTRIRLYAPSGAVVLDQTVAGALPAFALPAGLLDVDGAYEIDAVQCDPGGHCTTSPRAGLHWDGAAPAAGDDAFAAPLGILAARDGAHLTWPAAAVGLGGSGVAGGFVGLGSTPQAARAAALAAATRSPGLPGLAETAIPASAIHGAEQVCLAVRPLSGAGIAATAAAVRCAAVDEQPPLLTIDGAVRWSGGAQTLALGASDASGAAISDVRLDGAPVAAPIASVTVAGEGEHVLRVVAHDGAGNETVSERTLGIDSTPPVIAAVTADFVAREIRVGVGDALAGVALADLRLAGRKLDTRITADGRTAIARVPVGLALDGAVVTVRVLDAAMPANAGQVSSALPMRTTPVLRAVAVAAGRVTGRVHAAGPVRVAVWAYPKGRAPRLVHTVATTAGGAFSVRVDPSRTTRYAVAVVASQRVQGLREQVAGTLRVDARIGAPRIRVRGGAIVVTARFAGRGEVTRLHLLVHDVLGGRWVEACLQDGRPGVRLERDGRVHGTCAVPANARGHAWTYRLILAAPSSTWPWRTPSSPSVSLLLPA
jgi:hypothetical protein